MRESERANERDRGGGQPRCRCIPSRSVSTRSLNLPSLPVPHPQAATLPAPSILRCEGSRFFSLGRHAKLIRTARGADSERLAGLRCSVLHGGGGGGELPDIGRSTAAAPRHTHTPPSQRGTRGDGAGGRQGVSLNRGRHLTHTHPPQSGQTGASLLRKRLPPSWG